MSLLKKAALKYLNLYVSYDGNKGNFHCIIKREYPRFYNRVTEYFGTGFNQKIYNLINVIDTYPLCKTCNEKPVSFKNIETGYKTYCSDTCSYGDHALIEQRQNTMLEKYGVKHALQSKEIAKKVSTKNKLNFKTGSSGREKYLKTMNEKYGISNPMELVVFREKIINSHASRTHEQIEKTVLNRKKTKFKLYGDENYRNNEKIKSTLKIRYNVEYPNQTKCSNDWLQIEDKKSFLEKLLITDHPIKIARDYNLGFSTVYKLISEYGLKDLIRKTFHNEYEIEQFIKSLGFLVTTNNRKILGGKELDIFVDNKNIAIEHNGIYWHSESNGKDKNYHLNKTIQCQEKGIQLIHVFESEWLEKQEIVKSIIAAKLGKFKTRLFARNCAVREIDNGIKNSFLNENHSQGEDKSTINIGLFYNDELVSVMTLGNSRYNKNYQYEMHRFCTKIGHQIIGGASKLWSYFVKNHNPKSVITYADRRYSDGTFYAKIGFKKIGISEPNYFYFKNTSMLLSRLKFQKHKLKNILESFNPELTEWDNMQLNGYDRIWDCGNHVFGWKNS
jgi:hypothetical protein